MLIFDKEKFLKFINNKGFLPGKGPCLIPSVAFRMLSGGLYVPAKAMSRYCRFALRIVLFGLLMLGIRSLAFSAFVKKFSRTIPTLKC